MPMLFAFKKCIDWDPDTSESLFFFFFFFQNQDYMYDFSKSGIGLQLICHENFEKDLIMWYDLIKFDENGELLKVWGGCKIFGRFMHKCQMFVRNQPESFISMSIFYYKAQRKKRHEYNKKKEKQKKESLHIQPKKNRSD